MLVHNYFVAVFAYHLKILKSYFPGLDPKLRCWLQKMLEPISVDQRLCVTLKYLVTVDSHVTIAASYRTRPTTVRHIVNKTCAVIKNVLCDKGYVSPPST